MTVVRRVNPPAIYQGWVELGDVEWCEACSRRVWVWELHHLVPIGWGGDDSRTDRDHYIVWVKLCGDCHSVVHRILDHVKPTGRWDQAWVETLEFPDHMVRVARWGWNLAIKQGLVTTT